MGVNIRAPLQMLLNLEHSSAPDVAAVLQIETVAL
jgi:hypothetical protein